MRDLDAGNGVVIPANLLRAVTSRSGGPGGQNVNKVESKVTIELDVASIPADEAQLEKVRQHLATRINRNGVLRVTSQAARSQLENRDRALTVMETLLRDALEERAPRRRTRTPAGQKARRLEEKKRRAERKQNRSRIDF